MTRRALQAVAVICVRDDDPYLESCLRHLLAHGVDYAVIDNGMSAESRALLQRAPFRDRLRDVRRLPFTGVFELERQIEAKERVFETIEADWLIHLDVDEAMHAYAEGERLIDSIARIDELGFNVINFDEYVFLPVDQAYQPGACPQPLTAYYLFKPGAKPRLMRARRKSANLSMAPSGLDSTAAGHVVYGEGLRLAPEAFVLRHYIVRSQDHARRKYTERVYAETELRRGWHANRTGRPAEAFEFPPPEALERLPSAASHALDRSHPRRTHYWDWPAPLPRGEGEWPSEAQRSKAVR